MKAKQYLDTVFRLNTQYARRNTILYLDSMLISSLYLHDIILLFSCFN